MKKLKTMAIKMRKEKINEKGKRKDKQRQGEKMQGKKVETMKLKNLLKISIIYF